MPSQARLPPVEPHIPTTPFEAIAADYFDFHGYHYLVVADRLSGWIEVQQIKVGTNEAGAEGLCKTLRRMMVTFGVPVEISSDGGPEFKAGETADFFTRWGIKHRVSSVSLPSSNGRAELAVKAAKRMLEDNIGPDGRLDTDAMVRALLTHRNTPDPGCKLSPAQILLGRPLRDSLPLISKDVMMFNNDQFHSQWKGAWEAKEEALKARYVKTLETLGEHSRPLAPLRHGDHVMIQNQSGRFPKRWDKSGVIVEVRNNDQYVIKVSGSGRLTLRNRRFLRLYTLHSHTVTTPITTYAVPQEEPRNPESLPAMMPVVPSVAPVSPLRATNQPPPTPLKTPASATTPFRSPEGQHSVRSPRSTCTPQQLIFGDVHEDVQSDLPQSPVKFVRKSSRAPQQRLLYDASSGKYKAPAVIPDDI